MGSILSCVLVYMLGCNLVFYHLQISAFLEDDVVFSDEEQEDWFWDEEMFYETR